MNHEETPPKKRKAARQRADALVHAQGLAESRDGKHFTRVGNAPVFEGHRDEPDGGCVEDPRLVKMGDLYLLTYAARAYAPGQ